MNNFEENFVIAIPLSRPSYIKFQKKQLKSFFLFWSRFLYCRSTDLIFTTPFILTKPKWAIIRKLKEKVHDQIDKEFSRTNLKR